MHSYIRSHLRSAAVVGGAVALTVGGVALAQGGSGSVSPQVMPPGPPGVTASVAGPIGVVGTMGPRQNLTYAEFHVIENGQAKVVRQDAGKVVSASDSSITIGENDGNQVTIPVDSATQVLAGPGKKLQASDLTQGEKVNVLHVVGSAAQTIMVPPKPGDIPKLGRLPSKGQLLRRGPATAEVFRARGARGRVVVGGPPVAPGFAIPGRPPRGR